jgi:membrane associated rhomboid family serine protease
MPPVAVAIIGANVLLLVATTVFGRLGDLLALDAGAVLRGEVWRVITYAWVHGGVRHLASNCILLLPFALLLEARWGRTAFALVYVASCILVGLFLVVFNQRAIGASGAVCAIVLLAVLDLLSTHRKALWALLPEIVLGLAVVVLWLLPSMWGDLMGLFRHDQISHLGHLGGFLVGFGLHRLGVPERLRSGPRRSPGTPTPPEPSA